MRAKLAPRPLRTGLRQRGQAMYLTALLLALGTAAVIYSSVRSSTVSIANRETRNTAAEMVRVKEALIGWSASRMPTGPSPNIRPGELPCPDIDNTGTDPGGCVAGAIGRVPWRSLGIPEPKDSSGETLWYAIAGPFRNFGQSPAPITSDTVGTLTVHSNAGTTAATATTLTTRAVAVVFAPGSVLGAQNRDPLTVALCPTTGAMVARNLCAANYLDTAVGPAGNIANATTNGPFIQGPLLDPSIQDTSLNPFNDRVLAITNADLMPVVEQRVARELISWLNLYKAASGTSLLFQLIPLSPGVYPWADLGDGNSNAAAGAAYNRNRFPCGNALPVDWGQAMGLPPLLGTGTVPTLPNWLTNGCGNPPAGWSSVIYYAVARNKLEQASLLNPFAPACSTCTAPTTLSVTTPGGVTGTVCSTASPPVCTQQVIAAGGADLLLITPGAKTDNRGPPGAAPNDWATNAWDMISTSYFPENENRDNNDDTYAVPSSTAYNRSRIYVVR